MRFEDLWIMEGRYEPALPEDLISNVLVDEVVRLERKVETLAMQRDEALATLREIRRLAS